MIHLSYSIKEITQKEWDEFYIKIPRSNMMQSWDYGECKAKVENLYASRFMILFNDEPIAIFQVLLKKFMFLGSIARLNRGPLFLEENIDQNKQILKTLEVIRDFAKKKVWRLFYLAPEVENTFKDQKDIIDKGFLKKKNAPWGSTFLNLHFDEEELLSNLNGKWRNMLRKAQKSDIEVKKFSGTGMPLSKIIDLYKKTQSLKGFSGINEDLLKEILSKESPTWKPTSYLCFDKNIKNDNEEPIGMLVSIIHGTTATYLISYTDEIGRKFNANYLMLWNSIIDAKSDGSKYYDLGGLNKNTTPGVAKFKRGLKGSEYELIGEYKVLNLF